MALLPVGYASHQMRARVSVMWAIYCWNVWRLDVGDARKAVGTKPKSDCCKKFHSFMIVRSRMRVCRSWSSFVSMLVIPQSSSKNLTKYPQVNVGVLAKDGYIGSKGLADNLSIHYVCFFCQLMRK